MKPTTISALSFFESWKRVCETRKENLLAAWDRGSDYTSEIFDVRDEAVIVQMERELELKAYGNYYSLDAIFIDDGDRVHCAPTSQNWFQNIRVAFEHENYFRSGLFQEVSHLLITRADLRVLVTYPNNEDELEVELKKLAQIITASDLADSDP